VARDAHAGWRAYAGRADPIGILHAADATRKKEPVPLRYGRMLQSPFTFYRGSAGVLAADLVETPVVETYDAEMLAIYGKMCGWALARAHAKAGDPWTISGYLGNGGQFDDAMGKFALAYADQAEKDHAALKAAVRNGIVEVQLEH
jgi:hypothetical protein